MAVIVSVLPQKKLTHIARDQLRSKGTGNQIPTHQITFPAVNGNAAEANQ